jgi:ABC-type multidrug transport system fused ATPase/permease subunit
MKDEGKVREAARLGGAEEFIERLPNGFDTYLERPVKDYYSGLPEGTTSLFGRPVDYGSIRNMGGMDSSNNKTLSGGQMQRIALCVIPPSSTYHNLLG